MKLHCSKILLFLLPLNILVTSLSNVHSKNKPYITPRHTPTITSRVLRECDIHKSIYDNDEDMKSVKENFDRQISQRFEEYQERMKEKRQKRKEQRDKNIQKIIHKDKMEKNLAEKVEIGCLRCGCALGGVAASVGIFGAITISELKKAATAAAIKEAISAGTKVTIETAFSELKGLMNIYELLGDKLKYILGTITNFRTQTPMVEAVYGAYQEACDSVTIGNGGGNQLYCSMLQKKPYEFFAKLGEAGAKAITAGNIEKTSVQTAALEEIDTTFLNYSTPITASVIAMLIIVLIMVIIYLILRYRRKKKMKKKLQYTELLKE
ncbi:hypothetical protein PFFVO_06045 [Plasmodium falciparum Vietnam Oak-Knoll (FVO)]|uniref:Surface antigen n=1 Tax=Plasmodium falciparum Vietnam Oak-Knoll (FVO) TaxID=1036723 RepID=A0A024UXQ7_PLAFA|nr:hypothetical protein PFFVO_06045 [Plasmodium falciparum Vietnam Oak-Knoll (FVO)]